MNKRYMDFVPVDRVKKPVSSAVPKPVSKPTIKTPEPKKPEPKKPEPVEEVAIEEIFAVAEPKKPKKEPEFGIIEDYRRPNFVGAKIEKRPLGRPESKIPNPALAQAKSKKLVGKVSIKQEKEPVVPPVKPADTSVPTPKFVNTEKIEKRPLSKNVYKKKIEAPKEEPSAPVTIIAKPENSSHIGIIVTIILTIILGAAAGTVAFLLLPK